MHSYYLGVYLKETILKVLMKFNIDPSQIYTVTSDNGANMLNAINLLEKDSLPISDDLNGEINNDITEEEILEISSEVSDIDEPR